MQAMRSRLTYANVMATIAVFIALGGASYAALGVPKNSVGAKQLKKSAVSTVKIKRKAVTAAKIADGTLTGAQINLSTLGTVPTAELANSVAASEPWHEVGTAGEPQFAGTWKNQPPQAVAASYETVGFYKDREGVVHLKGAATAGTGSLLFQLPPGFRPRAHRQLNVPMICEFCSGPVNYGAIYGSDANSGPSAPDGAVIVPGNFVVLDGIAFRAES
jgi:hypothetical protein